MKNIRIPIIPRRMSFDLEKSGSTQDWCCNDVLYTAYMNGISLALPLGEHFFIRSIRQFEDQVTDPVLQDDLKRFVAQESIHSRQHELYNQLLIRDGYEIHEIQQRTQQALDEVWDESSPMERLAITIALEHITHVLGDQILVNRDRLSGWNSEFRAFWLWHAAEEVEHKAVCYDLYTQLGGTYFMRSKALIHMTARMLEIFWKNQHDLMAQTVRMRGINMPSAVEVARANMGYMFSFKSGEGLLRGGERTYAEWFVPHYHPWKHDNRQALENWKHDTLPLNHVADLKAAG
jgi:predicted metal-dependent hydrolase